MRKFLDWPSLATDYGRYHTTAGNRACHLAGIPLIVFCVVRWTLVPGTGFPLAAFVLPLYAAWDAELALVMTGVILVMGALAVYCSLAMSLALFVLGWAFQFVGHGIYEKKSPAFARNLVHLLVGPMWVLREGLSFIPVLKK